MDTRDYDGKMVVVNVDHPDMPGVMYKEGRIVAAADFDTKLGDRPVIIELSDTGNRDIYYMERDWVRIQPDPSAQPEPQQLPVIVGDDDIPF